MESTLPIIQYGRKLTCLKGCLAYVFVKTCRALKRLTRDFLRIEDTNDFTKTICYYLDGSTEIGIAADYHSTFECVVERIHQEMRGEV